MAATTHPTLSTTESHHPSRATILAILGRLWRTPEGKVGSVLFAFIAFFALTGDLVAPYDPIKVEMKERFQAPSADHWFGTDEVGRDVLSRVIAGTRISLSSALVVIGLAALVGIPLGMLAGYQGGPADSVIMRITDMFLGFPALLLAIAVAGALGPGLFKGMVASALVWWPGYARLARGQVLAIKEQLFVEAARSIGASHGRILFRHILVNTTGPFIIKFTMDIGYAILFISGLGFLGLGARPPTPEWGTQIADGRTYILQAWWYATFPGIAISIAVICFNFLGDAVQSALDPTMTKAKVN
jgi:peptide/nickel transport system permease protein